MVLLSTSKFGFSHLYEVCSIQYKRNPTEKPNNSQIRTFSSSHTYETIHSHWGGSEMKKIPCWSDSEEALCWIRGIDTEWKQFVHNRVKEITSLLPVESWRSCSTESNPADVPSKGMNSSQLAENIFWVMGPEWLSQHEKESKSIIVTEHIPEECLKEKTVKNHRNLESSTLVGNTNDSSISCVIDISRFSNLQRP